MEGRRATIGASLALLLGYLPLAHASTIPYFNIQQALSSVTNPETDHDANGTAMAATLGVSLPELDPRLSLEAEYTSSSSSPSYERHTHYDFGIFGGKYDYDYSEAFDYTTLAAYAALTIPSGDRQWLRARVGARHVDMEIKVREVTDGVVTKDTTTTRAENGLSFGLGLLYGFADHARFIVDATYLDKGFTHVSAGLQIKF